MVEQPNIFSNKALIILFLFTLGGLQMYSQCPSIINANQSFCDLDGPTISDLEATDNGGGVFWYDTATSTTPIGGSEGLISGEDYYADDTTGTCIREHVDVFIYGAPFGLNFQGVCVDDLNDATISDLNATGNNVQWYNAPVGGAVLSPTTVLNDNTIYYADQENPDTNCRTSRLSVLVNIGFVPVPTGNAIQEFCSDQAPTVADLVAIGFTNWYANSGSVIPLETTELLVNGEDYFATSVDPPCESDNRFEVTVVINTPANSGTSGIIEICETDINTSTPVNLIDGLSGSPETDGSWSGPFPTTNGSTGTVDITSMTVAGGPYIFTYLVDSGTICGTNSSTVTITIIQPLDAGTDGILDLCIDNNPIDLFTILGGSPEVGGTWSPALTSGTGVFDPSADTAGAYTYTLSGNAPCIDESATVTVTTSMPPDTGTNGLVDLCTNNDPIDLFTILGGSPEVGGTWSPALASGTGLFNPALDTAGIYTYTLIGAPPCNDTSANVTVTFVPISNAGSDANLDLCENDGPIDLFTVLGGTPDAGGTWSPALASGTGVFNPALDTAGIYTYTIAGTPPCDDSSATVTITTNTPPDAGINGLVDLCINNDPIDLFTILGGSPEVGGTWSPALASGTGLFDPAVDVAGIYTYTLTGTPPCDDQFATVTVDFITISNAGSDANLDLCENDSPIDLFTVLGGSPDTGGTWSPALASGMGVFDPIIDTAGIYTYTIAGTPPCDDSSATVTITTNTPPDAGINGLVDLCINNDPIDLFTILGGSPEVGGTWSPALASGTGLFDPAADVAGIYTYTLTGTPPCDDQFATVTVDFIPTANAGTDGVLDLCTDNDPIDLFTVLGGSPDAGGTWSPALVSGTGIFDPIIDTAGIYTYTISGTPPCDDSSATVTVTTNTPPDAGTNGSVDLCTNNDDPIDLFTILGGSPEVGGIWSPALSSGTGLFDPALDVAGIYTYTLTGTPPCDDQFATVTVSIIPLPNAGEDSNAVICSADGTQDLFNYLDGSPDSGGTWSPTLSSGTGIFDPILDIAGTYTYTVTGPIACNESDTSTLTVTIEINPDATELEISSEDICLGHSNDISISNANLLADGSFILTYNLSGTNQSDNTTIVNILNGISVFNIPANLLTNPGLTTVTITSITTIDSTCSADVSAILTSSFTIFDTVTPEIIENGNVFCTQDEATIENLSNNITSAEDITWFDAPTDGNSYSILDILVDGQTYYASALTDDGCESFVRLEITVLFEDCPEDIVIPDGFSPNDDSINDEFIIENLRDLYPNFTLEVYNRFGNILYKGDINRPDWDGTSEKGITLGNSLLPVGVYFFVLEFNDGTKNPIQGRVYLSR
jgi:gliding motility-associated-like protein